MSTMENEIIGMIAKRSRSAAPASVTLASTLDELGLESLDVIEMAFDLEERFTKQYVRRDHEPPDRRHAKRQRRRRQQLLR